MPEHPDDDGAGCAGRLQRIALLHEMGQYERVVEEAGRLCADFLDLSQAHLELALGLFDVGRIDEARREAREALALDPDDWAAFASAKLAPSRRERRDLMRRAVELDPGNGAALARLALFERRCGARRRRCRRLAERALSAEPYNASVHVAVAELKHSMEDFKRARARVNEALSLEPRSRRRPGAAVRAGEQHERVIIPRGPEAVDALGSEGLRDSAVSRRGPSGAGR